MFEKLPFNKLRYKKADLPSNKINDFVLPAITCTTENNGISCYVKKENATIFKNCISVAANGDAPVFYQSNEFTILQDAYVIDFKDKKLNKKENLFFTALLKKALKKFDWANKSGWERVKNENILLPTTQNGEIDFEFMESFVAELEAERVAELEAYLAAASLKDYELTADELSALSKFENYNWGEFRIGDLFTSKTGDTDLQQKDINGKGEYFLNSGYTNCGVNGKTDRPARIFLKNTITIDFLGYVFYRNFDYKMATHNHIFSLSGEVIKNEKIGLFLVASLSYLKNLFSFSNMGTWTKFKDLNIKLPITAIGEIDFEFMNNFIKAIKKLVIKDVVLYTDNKIKATKSIVSSNQ